MPIVSVSIQPGVGRDEHHFSLFSALVSILYVNDTLFLRLCQIFLIGVFCPPVGTISIRSGAPWKLTPKTKSPYKFTKKFAKNQGM